MRNYTKAIVLASSVGIAAPASAGEIGGGFEIRTMVPVVCSLSAENVVLEAQTTDEIIVSVSEFCNTNSGFQVVASHRALDATEAVSVLYGNDLSELHPEGMTSISFRSGARFGQVPVRIRPQALNRPISVNFALTAI